MVTLLRLRLPPERKIRTGKIKQNAAFFWVVWVSGFFIGFIFFNLLFKEFIN